MVSESISGTRIKDIKYYGWAVYEDLTVTSGDVKTLDDFVDTENLKNATLIQNSDGVEIAVTVLDNTVTVGGAVTDQECTLFAFGVMSN